jgi:hypothetical protein
LTCHQKYLCDSLLNTYKTLVKHPHSHMAQGTRREYCPIGVAYKLRFQLLIGKAKVDLQNSKCLIFFSDSLSKLEFIPRSLVTDARLQEKVKKNICFFFLTDLYLYRRRCRPWTWTTQGGRRPHSPLHPLAGGSRRCIILIHLSLSPPSIRRCKPTTTTFFFFF